MLKAREVLRDCRNTWYLLEEEADDDRFRILWIAGVVLARAVGHVLHKVDATLDPELARIVDQRFAEWKADPAKNAIFWDFIEQERNLILKEYELRFRDSAPLVVEVDGEAYGPYLLKDHLFSPMVDGPYAGEDCRDVLEEAIRWWERQLDVIEKAWAPKLPENEEDRPE